MAEEQNVQSSGPDEATEELAEEQKAEIKNLFEKLDSNGNNEIDASEFAVLLRWLGENPTNAEVEEALRSMDKNSDDRITLNEMFDFFRKYQIKSSDKREEELKEAFSHFDRDKDGFIRKNELKAALEKCSERMSEEDLAVLFQLVDTNSDGKISIDEFADCLLSE